jgi:hypothetical protein
MMLASVLGYRGISDVKPTNTNYPQEARLSGLIFRLSAYRCSGRFSLFFVHINQPAMPGGALMVNDSPLLHNQTNRAASAVT